MNLDKSLKFFVLILMLLIGVTGVYAARGLYADGSFWLFEMLSRGGFYIFDPHRAYAQILMQLPVVISLALGTQDLNFLIRAHSFGFVVVPLIFWIAALIIQIHSRLFWFFVMAFCVTYLRSNFFAAGEFNITYGMTAFCASMLLRQNINRTLSVLMVLTSVVLTHSYEMTLFLGPLLVALSAWRLWQAKQDSVFVRACVILAIIFFLVASYVGLQSAFFQRSYDGRSTANLSALAEIHFLYLLALPLLVTVLCLVRINYLKRILTVAIALLIVCYFLYALRWDQTNISFGYLSYAYRALVGLLLIEVVLLAFITRKENLTDDRVGLVVTLFFLSLAVSMLNHTYGFYKWIERFEAAAINLQHNTHINESRINTNHGMNSGYNWPWGNSYTSILLRGNAEAIVLNSSQFQSTDGSCFEGLRKNSEQALDACQRSRLYPFFTLKKTRYLFP
jgi:hypothetical protein